jgi:hypothetical protein
MSHSLVALKHKFADEARYRASQSQKWQMLFSLANEAEIESWQVVSFLYDTKAGTGLYRKHFVYERIAKLLASTEAKGLDVTMHTTLDLVNWNRKAIMAMLEAAKAHHEKVSVSRAEKALEILSLIFPEYILE